MSAPYVSGYKVWLGDLPSDITDEDIRQKLLAGWAPGQGIGVTPCRRPLAHRTTQLTDFRNPSSAEGMAFLKLFPRFQTLAAEDGVSSA